MGTQFYLRKMASACQKPGFIGFGSLLFFIGGYQYGNKKLRSLQNKHFAEVKKEEEERQANVASLKEQIDSLKNELDVARGVAPVKTEEPEKKETAKADGDDGWLSDWINV